MAKNAKFHIAKSRARRVRKALGRVASFLTPKSRTYHSGPNRRGVVDHRPDWETSAAPTHTDAAAPTHGDSEWVISIYEKLAQAEQTESAMPWTEHSIYRVPKSLRQGNEAAYVPQLVALGPYHHGSHVETEGHKWRVLRNVLRRTGHDLELYLGWIKSLEEMARACYEGDVPLTSNEFVEMMVLDGTFVLEILRWAAGKAIGRYSFNDPLFASRRTMFSVQRDMIMLENQLPLFVLYCLHFLQTGVPERSGHVAALADNFFYNLVPTGEQTGKRGRNRSPMATAAAASDGGLHCLDVFRQMLLRSGPHPDSAATGPQPAPWTLPFCSFGQCLRRWLCCEGVDNGVVGEHHMIHCVSELRESGIKFRKRNTDRFWDIKFKHGVLYIPRLLINHGTKSLFLNLIAFEQCSIDRSNHFTAYVMFMDGLINSDKDVGYLHYDGIIEHCLGNDGDVADLFNGLYQEVAFDLHDSYLSGLSAQVNSYCNHRWNAWRASLKHTYFGNPWAILSLVAALALLLLTFTQTFYAVFSYYWPSS